jgi:hypothetical protein
MTDLAIESAENHEAPASDHDVLKLKGNDPLTVYVRVSNGIVELSLDQTTWYSKGMKWKHGNEYALYITYSLVTDGIELHPSAKPMKKLWFSPVISGNQQGCIPPVTGTYHFRVKVPSSSGSAEDYIDPQIVVTPL